MCATGWAPHFGRGPTNERAAYRGKGAHLLVHLHGVHVGQAATDLGPVPEYPLDQVLLLEVQWQAVVAGAHHAACLAALKPPLVVARAARRRAVVRGVALAATAEIQTFFTKVRKGGTMASCFPVNFLSMTGKTIPTTVTAPREVCEILHD